jgi:hypothetical protein
MIKISKHKALVGMAIAAGALAWTSPAAAQATRTWVSGVGDDVNPCSRTAPCKTFAGAISKTAAGGEINCLDPGAFGAVTITKSLSIVCQYTEAGALATFGSSGIIINAAATDTIYLRGLDLNGGGGANPGLHGIRVLGAGFVHIEDLLIRNFRAANGTGIQVAPGTTTQVTVNNTTIADNGVAGAPGTGAGILIQPTGTGVARVAVRNSRIQSNGNNQIRIDTTGNTGAGVSLFVDNTQIVGGQNGISINQAAAAQAIATTVIDSFIALCAGNGVVTAGFNTNRVRVGNTTITNCGTALSQGGTTIINTYGTNRLEGNGSAGTFTLPAIGQQ